MKQKRTIPTIIGLIIVVIGIAFTVLATQYRTIFNIGASGDLSPQGVRITNVTSNSFTVSWITKRKSTGALEWGQSANLGQTTVDDISDLIENHHVVVKNLSPSSQYFFKIRSGGEIFDNNGITWQVTTGPNLTQSTNTNVLSGKIFNQANQPVENAMVYVTSSVSAPLSARTSSNGSWVLPLNQMRTSDNMSFAAIEQTTPLTIFVQGASGGIATAQAFTENASPTPNIFLGETYDFRNQSTISDNLGNSNVSSGVLTLPQETESESGFNLEDPIQQVETAEVVTLENIDDGEVVTTTRPQFFGDGPPGENLTIIVESDPITGQVSVSPNGNWQWAPPTNLPPGEHKLTIKWTDSQGILRTLVRSFTVSAAEGPSFETTPSASIATPKPLATIAPTVAPTAPALSTTKPSPVSSPRVSIPATGSGTPVAGSLTPTLALSIMGLALLLTSVFVVLKSFN